MSPTSARSLLDAQVRRARLLRELFTSVTAAGTAAEVLSAAAASAATTIGDAACVLLLSSDAAAFELAATRAVDREAEQLIRSLFGAAPLAASEGVAGRVLASGQPYVGQMIVPAGVVKPEYAPFVEAHPLHSMIAVPLRLGSGTIGVFELARYRTLGPFSDEDVEFLGDLASLTALAYERAAALHAEQLAVDRARVVAEFIEWASSARDEHDVLGELARRAAAALDCTCSVYLATPDRDEFEVIALAGARPFEEEGLRSMFAAQRWRTSEGAMGQAFATGRTVVRAQTRRDEREAYLASLPADRRRSMAQLDMRAVVAVPLITLGEPTGVFAIARWGEAAEPFEDEDRRFAEELARRANLAIERLALAAEGEADARRARVVAEFVESAAEASDERDVLARLSQAASDAVAGSLAIYRITPDGRDLDAIAITSHDATAEAFREMYARQRWRTDEGLMGEALKAGTTVFRAYLGPDQRARYLQTLPDDRRTDMAVRDLRAIIAIPLTDRGRQVGILTLARYGVDAKPFTDRDRAFAEELAARTNVALAHLALDAERDRESRHLRVLAEFLDGVTEANGSEDEILARLADAATGEMGDVCVIKLLSADRTMFELRAAAARETGLADEVRLAFAAHPLPADRGLDRDLIETGRPILARLDPGQVRATAYPGYEAVLAREFTSVLGAPLRIGRDVVGDILLLREATSTPFDERDLGFVEVLAGKAGLMLERHRTGRARDAAVAELERTSALLQTMFDASPLAMQLLDSEGRVLMWSPAAERMFGFTAEEAVGSTPPTIPADALSAATSMARRVAAGEIVEGAPARRVRKDGSELDVLLYGAPIRDESGRVGILGIYADVTERNRLDAELRRTSDTLRAILDASPLPIIAVDDAFRVTFWNRAAEAVYGWTADEVLGQAPPYAPTGDPSTIQAAFDRVRAGERVEAEAVRRRKDGREIDVRFVSAPLYDETGRFRGSLGISEDVTEQRRLEAELLQAQKMETVGRLAGGVAHDFNNILTAIIGYTDLATQLASNDEQARVLGTVKSAAERAAGLTAQLLAFSRRQMLQPRVVDANEVVLRMEPILQRLIGEDVELVASVTPDVGSVLVDPTQLEQVILNLGVNARDAMPDGGKLVLRTEAAHFNGDHSHLEMASGDYVVIHVADTGVGMDDETKAHIFEPFFTTKGVGQGTGLGLSTTYGIVRQSGGYIWVYSEPGRGTTFKLYFPRVGAAQQPEVPAPDEAPAMRRGRILLVEDEEVLRSLATVVLSRRGYEATVARHPAEALALAEDASFDLLATDVVMPGMTGIELARRLRERQPDLRVLFMSGYSEDVTDAAGSMTRRFLAKPFTPDALLRAVDEALGAEQRER